LADDRNQDRQYQFGLFSIDAATGELRKDGNKRSQLQGQPLKVLLLLLDRPGEVVTREELRNQLWPADTFVDYDHSLNTAVNKLRESLNDSAENPRFIQTLPRQGYRY
jgi:DNA-binding winged helix-turn-helix (wHTH) protein